MKYLNVLYPYHAFRKARFSIMIHGASKDRMQKFPHSVIRRDNEHLVVLFNLDLS